MIVIITSCANIGYPTGGPKDVTPPKILKSIPNNYSTLFNGKEIVITFDEYVVFNNLQSQLIVSPPLENTPDIKIKGKNVVINFKDSLRKNTTYTIYFGDAIADLHEGNVLSNYEFVFSTGNVLDSLTLSGRVLDAFTKRPEKDILVMLYDHFEDSVPYKEKPYYITKTKENGEYILNNLRDLKYKVFALKDANSNLLFDQPNERIAYNDSLVTPRIKPILIKIDSLHKDSLKVDSINKTIIHDKNLFIKDLNLFEEIDSTQRITRAEFIAKGEIMFAFRYPLKKLEIIPQFAVKDEKWKIEEMNRTNDTLIYWVTDSDMDSAKFIIKDNNKTLDTVNMFYRKHTSLKKTPQKLPKIILNSNLNGLFDYFNSIYLTVPNPIKSINLNSAILIQEKDTLKPKLSFIDSIHRHLKLNYTFKQATNYKLYIPDSIMTDIFGMHNDSLGYYFRTNSTEYVGNFIVNIAIDSISSPCIIQLLDDKEEVLAQQTIYKATKITYPNLSPGIYQLKAIYDKNNDGAWDTGKYLKKLQPEKVIYYPDKITIKANWDLEEKWKL